MDLVDHLIRKQDERLRRELAFAAGVILIQAPPKVEAIATFNKLEKPRPYGKNHRNAMHRGFKP